MKAKSSSISEKNTEDDDFNSLKSEKQDQIKDNEKSSKVDDDEDDVDEYEIVRQSSIIEEDYAEQQENISEDNEEGSSTQKSEVKVSKKCADSQK